MNRRSGSRDRPRQSAFLSGADVSHGLTGLLEIGTPLAAREMLFQVSILDARLAPGREAISDAEDDEPVPLSPIENAGAVCESASFAAQLAHLAILEIEHQDRFDGLGDLLAVRSDILNRSAANAAGNSAEALDSRAISGHGSGDEPVPLFAGAHFEEYFIAIVPWRSSIPEIATLRTSPGQPASATTRLLPPPNTNKGKSRERANLTACGTSAADFVPRQISRRPADFKGRKRRQGNVFQSNHNSDGFTIRQAETLIATSARSPTRPA